nr:MAG TPA_asm: hypothetical protein [Caudoviricetes sp.]
MWGGRWVWASLDTTFPCWRMLCMLEGHIAQYGKVEYI